MPAKDLRNEVVRDAVAFCAGQVVDLELTVQRFLRWKRNRLQKLKVAAYHRARKKLIGFMGGKCCLCGKKKKLEFDHPKGRTWNPAKTSRWARLARYRREWEDGEVRLLCQSCNRSSKNHP